MTRTTHNAQRTTDNRALFGRIGVLAGGPSNEREISIKSGKAVHSALIEEGCDAVFLDIKDDIHDIIKEQKIDVAFVALHGRFGEDGTVQKLLESGGIPYTGSGPEASRLAMDKIAAKEIFARAGIPTPQYIVVNKTRHCEDTERSEVDEAIKMRLLRNVRAPLVIKPQFEGSSIGLSVIRTHDTLHAALDKAFGYGQKALVEKFIDGRELTVGILGDRALPVIEIVTKNKVYDYTAKYSDPETRHLVPAPIERGASAKAKELARRAHETLGCRFFSRVDMMMDPSGKIFVLEVNTIPGMTKRSLLPKAASAVGVNFSKLCLMLVEDAINRKKYLTRMYTDKGTDGHR
jgi:D-alanine-D-alanine ligase